MASVDGAKSYLAGSDEVPLIRCGPCQDDGDEKEAKYYCEQCDEYLCSACKDYHKKFKANKTHKVLPVNEFAKHHHAASVSAFTVTCSCNTDLKVEIYCKDHTEVICSSCATIKHRKCKTSPIRDHLAEYSTHQLESALGKAKQLVNKIANYQRDREVDCQKLEEMKEECRKEIKEFRQEICDALEKMEIAVLKVLDKKANQQLISIDEQISTLSVALKSLNLDIHLLEKAKSVGKEDAMFAADIKTSKSLQEYDALVIDIESNFQTPRLLFQKNEKLANFKIEIDSLGIIAEKGMNPLQRKKTVILDMKVESSEVVNVKLQEDKRDLYITGCACMSNGYLVLCEYNNKRLKLLDKHLKMTRNLSLASAPWNVEAIDDSTVILTFPDARKLQYINIFPQLGLGKDIELKQQCRGIAVAQGEIYTTVKKESGETEIWRLNQSGDIISKITLTQNIASLTYYLSVLTQEINPSIYLTDCNGSSLTCLKYDRGLVFKFTDKDLKRANGLNVDSEGNSFVCDTDSHNVTIVTAKGKKHRELLTAADNIRNPICTAFRADDDTLAVGCQNNANLFVYKLATNRKE